LKTALPRPLDGSRLVSGLGSGFRQSATPSQAVAQWLYAALELPYRCGGSAGLEPASQFSAPLGLKRGGTLEPDKLSIASAESPGAARNFQDEKSASPFKFLRAKLSD